MNKLSLNVIHLDNLYQIAVKEDGETFLSVSAPTRAKAFEGLLDDKLWECMRHPGLGGNVTDTDIEEVRSRLEKVCAKEK